MNLHTILAPYISIPPAFVQFQEAGGFIQDPYCGVVYKDGTVDLEPYFVFQMSWGIYDTNDVYAYIACDHPKRWVAHVLPSEKVLLGGDDAQYESLLDSIMNV